MEEESDEVQDKL